MIEALTERNLTLQGRVRELEAVVADLEASAELNEVPCFPLLLPALHFAFCPLLPFLSMVPCFVLYWKRLYL